MDIFGAPVFTPLLGGERSQNQDFRSRSPWSCKLRTGIAHLCEPQFPHLWNRNTLGLTSKDHDEEQQHLFMQRAWHSVLSLL